MTPFTPEQKNVVAALFARTNMGGTLPPPQKMKRLFETPDISLADSVLELCGHLMESEEHLEAFLEEAQSWHKNPKLNSLDRVENTWPRNAALIEEALK